MGKTTTISIKIKSSRTQAKFSRKSFFLLLLLKIVIMIIYNVLKGASPHTGSWVPGPGSETQDPEPGTQDPISVPKVDKSF